MRVYSGTGQAKETLRGWRRPRRYSRRQKLYCDQKKSDVLAKRGRQQKSLHLSGEFQLNIFYYY